MHARVSKIALNMQMIKYSAAQKNSSNRCFCRVNQSSVMSEIGYVRKIIFALLNDELKQ